MRSDSQLSVNRFKNVLPYPFVKRSHRIMWAIGALVLFVTVPFLNPQPQANVDASYDNAQPAQPPSSQVRINDRVIPLPANGTIHKTIQNNDGQTKLDISVNTSGSPQASHSSTNLRLNVNSNQEITIENSE